MSVPSQAEIITDNFDYVETQAAKIGISSAMLTQTLEVEGVDKPLTIAATAEGDAINAELAKPIVKDQFEVSKKYTGAGKVTEANKEDARSTEKAKKIK